MQACILLRAPTPTAVLLIGIWADCFASDRVICQLISQQKADFKNSCMTAEYITNSGFYMYFYYLHLIFYR